MNETIFLVVRQCLFTALRTPTQRLVIKSLIDWQERERGQGERGLGSNINIGEKDLIQAISPH